MLQLHALTALLILRVSANNPLENYLKPTDYDSTAHRGMTLYGRWQKRTRPDVTLSSSEIEDLDYEARPDPRLLGGFEATALEFFKKAQPNADAFNMVRTSWERPGPPEYFVEHLSFIDASAGVFIRGETYLEGPQANLAQRVDYPEIAWYQWMKQCQAHSEADYSGLSSLWRLYIEDPKTIAILEYVTRFESHKRYHVFYPDKEEPKNWNLATPFWAILGTPDAAWVITLLSNNKRAMKGKGIKAIWVQATTRQNRQIRDCYELWSFDMWFELE